MIRINPHPVIPPVPRLTDKTKVDIRYSLIAPYANVHIYWDQTTRELVYELEEPKLSSFEEDILEKLESGMTELVNINLVVERTNESIIDYIDKTARLLINELNLKVSESSYEKLFYYLYRDFIGLNEIEPLLKDFFIEDIECNGVNTPVYLVHRIYRNLRTNLSFKDIDKLASFVEKLSQRAGRHLSYAQPLLDGTLPDGSRVNATYTKDVTSRGPTFTIRKFTKIPWTPTQLIALNTLSPEMLAYFWLLLQYKSNIFIIGGTASGKTTLLNALAFFIPPESRVVSIEDSVTGDSRIIIRKGEEISNITIKEFVDEKIDAEVLTADEKGKIIWTKPSNHIKHLVKKDIYEVTTATGRKVNVTQDHSLFCLGENNEFKEIKPTELVEGKSFIAVPRVLPIACPIRKEINLMDYLDHFRDDFLQGAPIKKMLSEYDYHKLGVEKECYRWWKNNSIIKVDDFLRLGVSFSKQEVKNIKIKSKNTSSIPALFEITDEFLKFCGLWLGDGSYDNYNRNSVIISNVDKECIDVFKKVSEYINSKYSAMNDGGVSLRIHSTVFYKFMKYVLEFDGHSDTKKIPSFIFGLSNEQLKPFIQGYFSADGCVKKNEVSCASQSYELLQEMQSLFLRYGIISRITDFDRKDKCISLSISSSENIQRFKDIGFLQDRKNQILSRMNKKAHHTSSDIIPISAGKMKRLGEISLEKLQNNYLIGRQNMGRNYMQRIAPAGCEFNDLSHNDIYWDKVKKIKKLEGSQTEVFDLSIPKHEKFLCNNIFVHNTRELNLPRENWIPAVARTSIGIGKVGEVDLFDLLKNSFRQNPDYVIVGEVRGKEAFVLFQGMASGHPSMGTIHADSLETMIRRLQTPPISLSPSLVNTLDCVTIISHAIVNKKQTRRLRKIVEIVDVKADGSTMINTPFAWNPAEDIFYFKKQSKVFEKIAERYGIPIENLQREFIIRSKLLYTLYQKKIFGFQEVEQIVNDYYIDPVGVLSKYGVQ